VFVASRHDRPAWVQHAVMGNQPSDGVSLVRPPSVQPDLLIASISYGREIDEQRRIDDLYYALVEQVTPFLPIGVVFQWNKQEVERIVIDISALDPHAFHDFQAASARKVQIIRDKMLQLPIRLEEYLLRLDPRLARLRYQLVPRRIKEAVFWSQYFEQLVLRLTDYVVGGLTLVDTNAARDKDLGSKEHPHPNANQMPPSSLGGPSAQSMTTRDEHN